MRQSSDRPYSAISTQLPVLQSCVKVSTTDQHVGFHQIHPDGGYSMYDGKTQFLIENPIIVT
jgi:hypothetical protein